MSNIQGKKKAYTREQVLEAIKGSAGVISTIAKRLNCKWLTAQTWCKNWEETKKALADEEEAVLDMAESAVYKSIQDGNTQDAKWLLATKGKKRGFSEKHEIVGEVTYSVIPAKVEDAEG